MRQTDRQISAEQDSGLIDWQSRPGSPGSGERYQEPVGANLLLVNVSHHHLDEGYLSVLKWVVSVVIQLANGECKVYTTFHNAISDAHKSQTLNPQGVDGVRGPS